MNSWKNEHNERQYNLILEMIFEFKKEKISIKQLISSLKSLFNRPLAKVKTTSI